jgi:hypothetical protein
MGLLLLAPVVETLLMVPMMAIAERLFRSEHAAVIASAVAWAGLHTMPAPAKPFIAFWGFVVLGYTFVYWRRERPHSFLWIVMLAHGFTNTPSALVTIWTGLSR